MNAEEYATAFRGPQVCSLVGITYRQLDYWARTDLIVPSLAQAAGSGTLRRYSDTDILLLTLVRDLLAAGISLQNCRRTLGQLREHPDAEFVLITSAAVAVASKDSLVDAVLSLPPVLSIIAFQAIRERVRLAIEAARTADDRGES